MLTDQDIEFLSVSREDHHVLFKISNQENVDNFLADENFANLWGGPRDIETCRLKAQQIEHEGTNYLLISRNVLNTTIPEAANISVANTILTAIYKDTQAGEPNAHDIYTGLTRRSYEPGTLEPSAIVSSMLAAAKENVENEAKEEDVATAVAAP